jgi:hypothetical protein
LRLAELHGERLLSLWQKSPVLLLRIAPLRLLERPVMARFLVYMMEARYLRMAVKEHVMRLSLPRGVTSVARAAPRPKPKANVFVSAKLLLLNVKLKLKLKLRLTQTAVLTTQMQW